MAARAIGVSRPTPDRRVRAGVERVRAGLARRVAQGKPLGRPRQTISPDDLARTQSLSARQAAAVLSISHAAVHRARAVSKTPQTSLADCA